VPRLERLLETLGKDRLLSDVDGDALAAHASRVRADLSPATVNHDLRMLRRVLRRARGWGVAVPDGLPFGRLHADRAGAAEALSVDRGGGPAPPAPPARPAGDGAVRARHRRPARERHHAALGRRRRRRGARHVPRGEVGARRRGAHAAGHARAARAARQPARPASEFVFTYECARTTRDRLGRVREAGRRYPFSATGWRRTWKRALAEAGVADFRFHDNRHTAGTRLLRRTGNLRLAQRMLGHTRIETTTRYAHVILDDLAEGMAMMTRNPHEEEAGAGGNPAGQGVDQTEQKGDRRSAGT
jgi:integrase